MPPQATAKAKNSFLFSGPPRSGAAVPLPAGCLGAPAITEPVAPALHGNDFGMMKETVQDGGGSRHIAEQFSPLLDRPIGSHESGSVFVAAHDDLEKYFSGFGWQDFK